MVYMKMPVSVRIFSSFVVPVPGMEVSLFRKRTIYDGPVINILFVSSNYFFSSWNLAFGYFHQNATFLTVFIRVVFFLSDKLPMICQLGLSGILPQNTKCHEIILIDI